MKLCRTGDLSMTRVFQDVARVIQCVPCCHADAGGIQAEICNLSQLETLNLRSNKLTGESWRVGCGRMTGTAPDRDGTLCLHSAPGQRWQRGIAGVVEVHRSEALAISREWQGVTRNV